MLAAVLIQIVLLGADAPVPPPSITWDPDILADVKRGGYDVIAAKMLADGTTFVTTSLGLPFEKPLVVKIYAPRTYERTFAPGRTTRLFAHYSNEVIHIDGGARIDAFFNAMLIHELTIAALESSKKGGQIPVWMREGLATVLEQEALGKPKLDVMQRILLKDAVQKGDVGTLASVKRPLEPSAYLQCQAAVQLLMERYGRTAVMQLYHDLAQGDDPKKGWEKLQTDPQQFATEFAAWETG